MAEPTIHDLSWAERRARQVCLEIELRVRTLVPSGEPADLAQIGAALIEAAILEGMRRARGE